MAFKLAIGNLFSYPVHIQLHDETEVKNFKFTVTAKRIDAAQAKDLMTVGTKLGDQTIDDFLKEHITNWRGQTLVLDEADQPVAYSLEALGVLLATAGASATMYQAYLAAVLATDGAQGVRKN